MTGGNDGAYDRGRRRGGVYPRCGHPHARVGARGDVLHLASGGWAATLRLGGMDAATPPPIAGRGLDPPPRAVPVIARRLEGYRIGRIGYRAIRRYSYARAGLLASGTAYYLFLALLSLLAFAYGLIAVLGADALAKVDRVP